MIDRISSETPTCAFGYGDIAVSFSLNVMILRGVKPPMECGATIISDDGIKMGDWEYTGQRVDIPFNNSHEMNMFTELLEDIETNRGGVFMFKGVKFDFTKYDQRSMVVVKSVIRRILANLLMAIAC